MQQNLAEDDDRCVVARRIFIALCALYPDRYLTLVLPGDHLHDEARVAYDPFPATALNVRQSPAAP
jgi:hypothetical protein